MMTLNKI